MSKKQRRDYKAVNQRRKAYILMNGLQVWLGGAIQDGKYTKKVE